MEAAKLTTKIRDVAGSRVSRKLRANGIIPAILYGHKEEPVLIEIPDDQFRRTLKAGLHMVELNHDGKSQRAIIKDIQYDTLTETILHIDFTRVLAGEKVKVELHVKLLGTAAGVTAGGILELENEMVEVECAPEDIPSEIEVRVSDMQIHDVLHVSDLPEIKGVKYLTDGSHIVLHILPPKKVAEEETEGVAEEGESTGEPEVLTERKDEEQAKG